MHTFFSNGGLPLAGSSHRNKRDWSRSSVKAWWECWSSPYQLPRVPGSFQSAVSVLWLGVSSSGTGPSRSGSPFLTNSVKPPLVVKPDKAAHLPVVKLQGWCAWNLLLREDSLACDIPFLFSVPGKGYVLWPDDFPPLPADSMWIIHYSLGCRTAVLLVSRLISARVAPNVVVLWCVPEEGWA